MNKIRVLLADDELDFIEIMGEIITKWGYNFIGVPNGKEAMEAVAHKKADIVILDYKMEDMDGITVLKDIRSIDSDIPVIMLTAYPEVKAIREAERLGVSAFIPKVTKSSSLSSLLKEAIHLAEVKLKLYKRF